MSKEDQKQVNNKLDNNSKQEKNELNQNTAHMDGTTPSYRGGSSGNKISNSASNIGQKSGGQVGKRINNNPFGGPMAPNNDNNGTLDTSNNDISDEGDMSTSDFDDENNSSLSGRVFSILKALPLKYKIVMICIGFPFLISLFFITVIFAPLLINQLGLFDFGKYSFIGGTEYPGSVSIVDSVDYFWPIGDSLSNPGDNISPTVITSLFGYRTHPISGKLSFHSGVDIAAGGINDVNIVAAKSGTVIYVCSECESYGNLSCGGGYGNYVMIQHPDGAVTVYAHMHQNSISVSSGSTVKQGQVIGRMGSSGNSTGTHLHFEIRINGTAVDPLNYVSPDNPRPSGILVDGSGNLNSVCLSLKNYGFSDAAIGGIMANIEGEGMFSPTCIEQGYPYEGFGIIQWSYDRKKQLMATYGPAASSLNSQLEFLFYELEGEYINVLNGIKAGKSAYEVTKIWCEDFEKPRSCSSRLDKKKYDIYEDYAANGCSGHTVKTSTFCAPDGQYIEN